MLEKIKQTTTTQRFLSAGLIVVVFIIYNVVLALSRIGEVKVVINVIPKDAKVTINNNPSVKRTVYLAAEEYTFSASADGWKTDTQTIKIDKGNHIVYLLPDPRTEAVKNWLKNNPDIQLERESFGGKNVDIQSQQAFKRNPILEHLPYTAESPPFTIDYGPSKERSGDIFLIISNSSPNGRQAALDWIRQHGQDPADLEIVFSGFVNPLGPEVRKY